MSSTIVCPIKASKPENIADSDAKTTKAQLARGKPACGKAKNTTDHTMTIVIIMNITSRIYLSNQR
jgi:hypothetical protein